MSALAFLREHATVFMTEPAAGYLTRPIPCALDGELIELTVRYRSGDAEDCASARAYVDRPALWSTLLTFAERMANAAVRERSARHVEAGLTAVAIEDFRIDAREDWLVLALLYRSAAKLGADGRALFCDAARWASERAAAELIGFAQRADLAQVVEHMGYREDPGHAQGFRYLRQW